MLEKLTFPPTPLEVAEKVGQLVEGTGINATATADGSTVAITAPAGVEFLAFYAPRDFSSGDSYTLNGTSITLTDLRGEPLEDAWKQGSPVQLAVKGNQAFFKGGAGGINQTLPPQVTGLTAKASGSPGAPPTVTVSWTNPAEYWAGTLLVRKAGSAPEGVGDGEKVCSGTKNTFTDTAVEYDTDYYYRAFPYNPKKQYQTLLTGAVVSVTPRKLPLPDPVTDFTATGSDAPSITLNWVNPAANWVGTKIVKKEGSAPAGLEDGTTIYDGTETSYVDTEVQANVTYYYRAFPYNEEGVIREYNLTENVVKIELKISIPLSAVKEGGLVSLKENGQDVHFYVAKHDYESYYNGTGRTLVVRKDCYDERQWHTSQVNAYATSDIDKWLNSTYKNLLDANIQEAIGTTQFLYTIGNGDTGLTLLRRSVFLLSALELGHWESDMGGEGNPLPIANTLKIAYLNGAATVQWTRSPRTNYTSDVWYLDSNGGLGDFACSNTAGSRPVFTLPATFDLNPTPNPDGSYRPMT